MPFNKYALLTILNRELYFSNPKLLNDPIDCLHNVKVTNLSKLTTNDLLPLVKKHKSSITWNTKLADDEIAKHCLKENDSLLRLIIQDIRLKTKSKYGICSFSTSNKDQRLWSHYADSSKGICLVFEKAELLKNLNINTDRQDPQLRRYYGDTVNYDGLPYEIEIKNGEFQINEDYFFKKTNVWDYEDEYRLLLISDISINNFADYEKNRYCLFTKSALRGVILGEKTTHYDLLSLLKIKSRLDYGLKITKLTRDISTGELNIEK